MYCGSGEVLCQYCIAFHRRCICFPVVIVIDCTSSLVLHSFVAAYLTFAQLNFRLNFCLYTTVHLLLEECRFSLKSSLSTQSVCYKLRPGVRVQDF